MNEQEFRELAAGHALRALSVEEEAAFAAALAAHPHWRSIVDEDRETAALLGLAAPAAATPADLRARILDLAASTPQGVPAQGEGARSADTAGGDPGNEQPRRRLGRMFALAASIVLIAGVVIAVQTLTDRNSPSPASVALHQVEAAPDADSASADLGDGGSAKVHWSDSLGKTVIVAEGLPDLGPDQTFELWLVRGEKPLPAGLMDARDGSGIALVEGDLRAGDIVAVTVEPVGGSPTGAPSSEPIVAIATA